MARDDFSKPTIDTIASRVGYRCSNPNCKQPTSGPRSEASKSINIGVGAHITAASLGGPRFDKSLSQEQRQSAENGIWLCQNCAKLIDNDQAKYTVKVLKEWKGTAEQSAHAEIEGTKNDDSPKIQLDIGFRRVKIDQRRHDYLLQVFVINGNASPLTKYNVDVRVPATVLENPTQIPFFTQNGSDGKYGLFRCATPEDAPPIFPGDAVLVMQIPYFMDDNTFERKDDLFEKPVSIVVYDHNGHQVSLSVPFEKLQEY